MTPPTFAGLATHTLDPTLRTIRFTWAPAADDATPPAGIVYEVFQRSATDTYDPLAPIAMSAPGATEITVTGLAPATTSFWTVRARDADFNYDANTVEVSGTTFVSYSENIAPIFIKNCAVVGCHTSALPMGGLSLSAWTAYDSIVGVPASQRPPGWPAAPEPSMPRITPGSPDDSYLYQKLVGTPGVDIVGARMPAPGTGNVLPQSDIERFATWITQGAPRN